MKTLLVSFLCLSAVALPAFGQLFQSADSGQRVDQIIAITEAALLDGSGRAPLQDTVVVVVGDRIAAAGSRQGMKADLVLFDAERIIDRSTFKKPRLIADGVNRVFVNGAEVRRDGAVTSNKPGQVLRSVPGRTRTGAVQPRLERKRPRLP